ncbi:hypothetical protein [Chondrinema litorale]|uniref:hypothetical protein n=1 Tax=Chondrinema litorale TaxID=2994555 RepID=UPI0025431DEB|nr:hypothetical protein [Chondrinema litorale]UZR95332.1 hypothetical protein OQ292_05795 [Chondrinema litorale]
MANNRKYELGRSYQTTDNSSSSGNQVNINVSNGQTTFMIPENNGFVAMFINGVLQRQGIDYTIIGSFLEWISTDFSLESTDVITIHY